MPGQRMRYASLGWVLVQGAGLEDPQARAMEKEVAVEMLLESGLARLEGECGSKLLQLVAPLPCGGGGGKVELSTMERYALRKILSSDEFEVEEAELKAELKRIPLVLSYKAPGRFRRILRGNFQGEASNTAIERLVNELCYVQRYGSKLVIRGEDQGEVPELTSVRHASQADVKVRERGGGGGGEHYSA